MPNPTQKELLEFRKASSSTNNNMPEPSATKDTRRKSSTRYLSKEELQTFTPVGNGDYCDMKYITELGEINEPQTQRLSRKRKVSTIGPSSSQPQKRVRFSQNPTAQAETFTQQSRQTPFDFYRWELEQLLQQPTSLSLTDISGCFHTLQKMTENFSKQWFGGSESFTADVNLHELKEKHPALFYTMQYVLDASSTTGTANCGWHEFLANGKLRQHLASAVLGEWFIQRIFKHTAFGLNPAAQLEISEQIDKKYLHHDAIVRAKLRSRYIKDYYDNHSAKEIRNSLKDAILEFTDELSTVLGLLMPASTLDQFDTFSSNLQQLIGYCAGLHLSMLLTGSNGTVFMYPGAVSNGTTFHRDHNHFVCVNPSVLKRTMPSPEERLVVKMTCWTRVEAYIPYGKDMLEMAQKEQELIAQAISTKSEILDRPLDQKEIAKIRNNFDWADSEEGRKFWKPLPEELWADAEARIAKQDMMARSAAIGKIHDDKRRKEEALKEASDLTDLSDSDSDFDVPNTDYNDDEETTSNDSDEEDEEEKIMYGPYTSICHCICPHIVYCEWTRPEPANHSFTFTRTNKNDKAKARPPTLRQTNTLAAAVAQARSDLHGFAHHKAVYEDLVRRLWDVYATNSLYIEWGFFLAAVLLSLAYSQQSRLCDLYKHSPSSVTLAIDTVKELLKDAAAIVNLDSAKLSETLQQFSQSHRFKAFSEALSNMNPRTIFERLMIAPPQPLSRFGSTPAFPVVARKGAFRRV